MVLSSRAPGAPLELQAATPARFELRTLLEGYVTKNPLDEVLVTLTHNDVDSCTGQILRRELGRGFFVEVWL